MSVTSPFLLIVHSTMTMPEMRALRATSGYCGSTLLIATGALTSPPTRNGASGFGGGGASVITPPTTPPTTPPATPPSTPPSTPPVTPASDACVATGCTFSGTMVGAISWMFLGTSTGFTTCTEAALGGGGGGGGGGGAEATEYCATWAGEFIGKSTLQIAPT